MTGLETALLIGSTAISAVGAVAEGISASNAKKAEAAGMERQANEERAASQREAVRRSREAQSVISRQQALASASGGGTGGSVLKIMADTAGEGGYQTATALYEGEARGRGLEDQAAISRMQGRQAKIGGFIGAGSTMLSGLSSYASLKPGGSKYKALPKQQLPASYWQGGGN